MTPTIREPQVYPSNLLDARKLSDKLSEVLSGVHLSHALQVISNMVRENGGNTTIFTD